MKKIIILIITLQSFVGYSQCWFKDLLKVMADDTTPTELKALINSSVSYEDAYKIVYNARGAESVIKTDVATLEKIVTLQQNTTFMQKVGGNSGLEEIIKANVRVRCKSCGNSGANFLKHVDEYLDDVEHFVTNYKDIDGFDEVLSDLKKINENGSHNYNMEGASFMLRVLKADESTFLGKVTKFEGSIDDLTNGCRYDLTFTNGNKTIFGEFKSYGTNSLGNFLASNSATLQQFETYLGKINSIDELRYLFDVEKISDLGTIKSRFKTVFENNDTIFDSIYANSSLRNSLLNNPTSEVQALQRFDDLVSELDNPNITNPLLYSFINSY